MERVLGDRRAVVLLLGPALLVYTLIMLVPVLSSLGYVVFDGNPIRGFEFVGTANFRRLASDPQIGSALWFTVRYALLVTVGQVAAGYMLALLYLFVLRRSSVLVRTLVFFPVVLPTVAVGVLFQRIFQYAPQRGLINSLLETAGLAGIDWFSTPAGALLVLVLMDIWRAMGFYAVLVYAGLLDIPDEILESARLDGARRWSLVRHVVLPLSAPILVACLVFSINGTLKVFDSILAVTDGGPGTSTVPLALYMFRSAFSYGSYGYGATVALLLTILCLTVTVGIFRANQRSLERVER